MSILAKYLIYLEIICNGINYYISTGNKNNAIIFNEIDALMIKTKHTRVKTVFPALIVNIDKDIVNIKTIRPTV